MKKSILTLAIALIISLSASAGETIINFNQLPVKAQDFITTHFKDKEITYVMMDKDLTHTEYTVRFADNTKIDFVGNGEWEEISNKTVCLPTSFIPENIVNYMNTKHNGFCIKSIEKEWNKITIELNNEIELIFNTKGEFLRYDD